MEAFYFFSKKVLRLIYFAFSETIGFAWVAHYKSSVEIKIQIALIKPKFSSRDERNSGGDAKYFITVLRKIRKICHPLSRDILFVVIM